VPGTEGGSEEDGCAGAGQTLDEKKSLSKSLQFKGGRTNMLEQACVSLPNKMTQVRF